MIAALATGRNPVAAMAAAQVASATKEAMQRSATVTLTPSVQAAASLASGDAGKLGSAGLSALAHKQSPDMAAAAAVQAAREKQVAVERSQTPVTDVTGAALAAGSAPAGKVIVVRQGVTTLTTDNKASQLATATVVVAPGDAAVAMASGKLPEGLRVTPQMSAAVAKGLSRGESLNDAIAHASASAAPTEAATPATPLAQLATGRIDPATLGSLGNSKNMNAIMKNLGALLQKNPTP